MEISKNPSECAFHVDDNKDYCINDSVAQELYDFAKNIKNIVVNNNKDAITKLKDIYDCKNESCLLVKNEVVDAIGIHIAHEQLENRFKPYGPYKGSEWFSNIHIDNVLQQIEKKYDNKKFKHVSFQMRDFANTGGELAKIDFAQEYKDGIRCFGVVFNTDKSSGNGQHWYALFGDFNEEPFTIEYFNSSGDEPQNEIKEWMLKTKNHMKKELNKDVKDLVVSKFQHQTDNHSCGSYSLYYILSRLSGIPYTTFSKKKIPDESMHQFRYTLFRKPI